LVWNVRATVGEAPPARLTNPVGALGAGGLVVVLEGDGLEVGGGELRDEDWAEHAAAMPAAAAAVAPSTNVRRLTLAAGPTRGGP
jgi:hypothetical protein